MISAFSYGEEKKNGRGAVILHCANFHKNVSPKKRALFTTMSSLKIEEAPLPAGTAPEPLNQSVQEFRLHHRARALPTVSHHHVMPPSMPTHNLHWHASRYYEVRAIWEGNQEKGRPMSHRLSHQSYQTRPRVKYVRPNNSSSCAKLT